MIAVPVFDVEALLQWADVDVPPSEDPDQFRLWNQIRSDCAAAAEHIALQAAALAESRGPA